MQFLRVWGKNATVVTLFFARHSENQTQYFQLGSLKECGHEVLQFYWFGAATSFYNSMLCSNSDTVRKVLESDSQCNAQSDCALHC